MNIPLTKTFPRNEFGYTLIELLTYVALASVILMGVNYFFMKSTDIYSLIVGQSSNIQNAQIASDFLSREAQNVRDRNSILMATTTEFRFTNSGGTVVDLLYSNQQLTKNNTAFAKNITVFSFNYYKWDGTSWTLGSATNLIAKLKFIMTVTSGANSFSIDNYVLLRNMQ